MNDSAPNALSLFGTVVGAATGLIGLLSGIWSFVFDPDGNLLLRLVYAVTVLLVIVLGVCLYALTRQRERSSHVAPEQTIREPLYSDQSRRRVKRLTVIGVPIMAAIACGALWADHRMTPIITHIQLVEGKPHEVSINGERFGARSGPIAVIFGSQTGEILETAPDLLLVKVPTQFEDGLVIVRRGPRTSATQRLTRNRMKFGVMVAQLFDPADETRIGEANNKIEPYPGFPYYSRASDHPNEWPPRVWLDRQDLLERVKEFFDDDLVKQRLNAVAGALSEESGLESFTSAPTNPYDDTRDIQIRYARMRQLFNMNVGMDEAQRLVGEEVYNQYTMLEEYREFVRRSQPNRILVLRLLNSSNGDSENVRIEFDVAGTIYDMTVIGGEDLETLEAQVDPGTKVIIIPRFLPSQVAEIKVWYRYLSTEDRVFSEPMDVLLEATQGISIRNILVSNGFVESDDSLIADIRNEAYRPYEILP